MSTLRARLYRQLDPLVWPGVGLSPINRVIVSVVLLSVLGAVFQSEPEIRKPFSGTFLLLNALFAGAFTVEYFVRLWAMGESRRYAGVGGRTRYAFTGWSLVDLVATVALWVDVLFGVPGVYGVLLRLGRALRILTLTRNSQWATAIRLLGRAISSRLFELSLSFSFAGIILLISATLLFVAEGQKQPEAFGSIPRAMWWAVATLTTVGYGDVYPITTIGKLFAGIAALTSIAIVAMPTGIMAAAFSDAFQRLREPSNNSTPMTPIA